MKKRSSVIACTLAAVLALSNLSPAAVYAAAAETANAASAATEEASAKEAASAAEELAAQENEEEEASPAGMTDAGSEEISAPEEAAEETAAEESTAEEAAALKDEALADDEEVDADAAIEADTSAENTDSKDEAAAEAESEEETEIAENAEESASADPVEKVTEDPAEANKPVSNQPTSNQPAPEQPVVEPADAMEIIYSDGITEGSGREAKAAGTADVDVDEILSLEVIPTDVSSASDGCILAGVPGKYIADAQAALDRINEIRREACMEGVTNPDTGRPLTMEDYVPIKWSRDLEYIARIRAAESAFTGAHMRANGGSWWDISGPSGVGSCGEVIAWNWSKSVVEGINQWYREKEDWISQTEGAVTGHYTSMIDPTNRYIGLGTFCTNSVYFYNTTVGEFCGNATLDETPMEMTGDCLQMIEFATSNLSGSSRIIGKMTGSIGEKGKLLMATETYYPFAKKDVYLLNGVTWSSSDPSVVTVSADGMTTVVGYGTSTIEASAADGSVHAEAEFSVKHSIKDSKIALAQSVYTYDGAEKKPAVTVTNNDTALVMGVDYTVSYTNNVNAGTATVTVTGDGNYEGEISASFTIGKANQNFGASALAAAICVGKTTTLRTSGAKGTVTWSSANPAIASVSGTTLKALKAGIVTLTATASGDANYNQAAASITIAVLPGATTKITTANLAKGIKVTWAKVAGANGYFIYRNGTLVKTVGSGSTVSFSDTGANTNGKKYVYKIVARASSGKSTLSKSLTTYRVSRPAIKSLKNSASKKMTVKWGKNSKASGYIVQYGLKSNFKGAKTTTLSKATLISKTIAKLTKGKVYYVRVRAFKKVGSKKYYSAWSAAKKVKISK